MGKRASSLKVKLNRNPEERELFYTTRSLDIRPDRGPPIQTPQRGLTQPELDAKALARYPLPLSSAISGVSRTLNSGEVASLLTDNEFSENQISSLDNLSQRMQHSSLTFAVLQPSMSAVANTLTQDKYRDKFLRMNMAIQQQSGMQMVTVPWVEYSSKAALECFETITRDADFEPVFFLDTRTEPQRLREICDFIKQKIRTDEIHFVGLIHRPIRTTLASCDELWSCLKDEDVALILTGVERYDPNLRDISGIHMNEFILGDILLTEVRRRYVKPENSKKPRNTGRFPVSGVGSALRAFDKEELVVRQLRELSQASLADEVARELGDGRFKVPIENYLEAGTDERKYDIVKGILRTHEFVASQRELNRSREYISAGDTDSYLSEKEVLGNSLRAVRFR